MADTKLTGLAAITSVNDDDLLYVASDPTGTAVSKKIRVDNFVKSTIGNSKGDMLIQPGPVISDIAPAGQTSADANQVGWKCSPISSVTLAGTIYQAYGFWNEDDFLSIAVRTIPGEWTVYITAISFTGGGDGHNYITLGFDPLGYLHICYDMHSVTLRYRMSTVPISSFAGVLTNVLTMLGTNEDRVTYPTFINDPQGNLYFIFRQQDVSNYSDIYFYKYNHNTLSWSATTGAGTAGIIIDGITDTDWAYPVAPYFDDNFGSGGKMHLFFTFRIMPADTYNNLFYMAWDGTSWLNISGTSQTIPARTSNSIAADTLSGDSAQPTILSQVVYSDWGGHPHIVYARENGDSLYHLYHLWHNGTSWIKLELADVPTVSDATYNIWPIFVMDRESNTAIIVYTDHGEGDTHIYMLMSDPNNFTLWNKYTLYYSDTDLTGAGTYQPKYDMVEWERTHRLMIPIEQYGGVGDQPIYLLSYIPSGWSLLNHSHSNSESITDPVFQVEGSLNTGTNVDGSYICPRPGTISSVYIYCQNPGTGTSTIVDVNLNGISIFTNQSNRPTLAWNDADKVAKSGTPDITSVVENDVISIDIDQKSTDAEDLTVVVAMNLGISADGWINASIMTYASADDPTYTATMSGNLTGIYQAGQKIKLTQATGGTKYFIVTKVAYSAPNTVLTLYGGTDYNLENEAISNPYYSLMKAPFGFPLDPTKWTVEITDASDRSKTTPTQDVWYNLDIAGSISIPIGIWSVSYWVGLYTYDSNATSVSCFSTLSTANNSESDADFTSVVRFYHGAGIEIVITITRTKVLSLTSKTTYYLNSKTSYADIDQIDWRGSLSKTIIRAVCAYL